MHTPEGTTLWVAAVATTTTAAVLVITLLLATFAQSTMASGPITAAASSSAADVAAADVNNMSNDSGSTTSAALAQMADHREDTKASLERRGFTSDAYQSIHRNASMICPIDDTNATDSTLVLSEPFNQAVRICYD